MDHRKTGPPQVRKASSAFDQKSAQAKPLNSNMRQAGKPGSAHRGKAPVLPPPVYRPSSNATQPRQALRPAGATIRGSQVPPHLARANGGPAHRPTIQQKSVMPLRTAPPVYRPQNKAVVLQSKMRNGFQQTRRQAPPPVYRPQMGRLPVQSKAAIGRRVGGTKNTVIQRVLMYTYPAGSIIDAPYTIEQVMGFGKTAVTHQGMTVWTHPDNVEDTAIAIERLIQSGRVPSSRTQTAYVPLRQDQLPQLDELEEVNPDGRGADLIHEGKTYQDCVILKLKSWDFPAIGSSAPIFPPGKVFCWTGRSLQDEEGELIELTSQKIAAYWNTVYKLTEGYTSVPGGGAEHRINCAGYALEKSEDIETTDANSTLEGIDYERVATLSDMEQEQIQETLQSLTVNTRYVLAQTNHFFRLKPKGLDAYILSEKNSSGPVYEKLHTADTLASFLHGKANLRLYKRK